MPDWLDADGYVRLDTAAHDIADCQLCDTDGLRNGFPCDHQDHRQAAQRGMDAIRKAMGWKTPDTPQKAAHVAHSPSNGHPNTTDTNTETEIAGKRESF